MFNYNAYIIQVRNGCDTCRKPQTNLWTGITFHDRINQRVITGGMTDAQFQTYSLAFCALFTLFSMHHFMNTNLFRQVISHCVQCRFPSSTKIDGGFSTRIADAVVSCVLELGSAYSGKVFFNFYFYFIFLGVCLGGVHMLGVQGQRPGVDTLCIMWVLGIELRWSDLASSAFTH